MEDLGDYMIRIDNTDSAPITFNMNPSVLFPELSDQLQLTKKHDHYGEWKNDSKNNRIQVDRTSSGVFGDFTDDTGNLQGRGICSFYKSDQHLYGVYRHWIIRR
jgi:hypothetical protein